MAVAEELDEEEVVFVPVLGNNTALCCDSPPVCTMSADGGMDVDVGVVATD
jgi:hypothetical protein